MMMLNVANLSLLSLCLQRKASKCSSILAPCTGNFKKWSLRLMFVVLSMKRTKRSPEMCMSLSVVIQNLSQEWLIRSFISIISLDFIDSFFARVFFSSLSTQTLPIFRLILRYRLQKCQKVIQSVLQTFFETEITKKSFSFLLNFYLLNQNKCNQYLLVKYLMFCSNNNGSALLLAWVNQELSFLNSRNVFYDFEHLKTSNFVYQLYLQISQTYFGQLNHLSFEVASYLPALEEYLIEVEGKKLTRSLKKQIIEQQSIEQFIKIGIFLLLQGTQKGEFINRIVEMNVQVQTYLMEELKRVQESIQNFVEIKDILSTVQKLEQENQLLKQKIKGFNEINQQLSETVTEIKQENVKIQKEITKYQCQKKQIFQELEIVDLKEYVQLYKSIKNENQELNYYVQELDEKRRETQTQNKALKQKISDDCEIINSLSDEVNSIKSNYTAIKLEMSSLNLSCCHSVELPSDNALRQNKNFGNVKVKQSAETSCTDRTNIFLKHLEEDEENDRLRSYNHDIMNKLEVAYKSITQLSKEVSFLKDQKAKLQKKNGHLQRKMWDLKKQQMRFMKELKQIGF